MKDAYTVGSIDAILDKLGGAKYISKIDLKNAYLQVPMAPASKKYTAFSVRGMGRYPFRTMPFRLTNAPATFCRLVDALLGPEFEPHVFPYVDDIIIVSCTYEEHLRWLKLVLDRLVTAGFKVSREKCEFYCSRLTYLEFLLDAEGLRQDPEKTAPVMEYPAPTNIKELRRFLGITGRYSRFMEHELEYNAPLSKLLHMDQAWEWGEEQQKVFEWSSPRFRAYLGERGG